LITVEQPAGTTLSDAAGSRAYPGWKGVLISAADTTLIGVCVVVAALPIVTLGAAAATGSFAIRHRHVRQRFPQPSEVWRLFLRWILPGALAFAMAAGLAALLAFDLRSVARGMVPGGPVVVVVTIVIVTWLVAVTTMTLLHLGRWPGDGWWSAVRWAARVPLAVPHRVVVPVFVATAAILASIAVPAASPLLAGFGLLGVHLTADKLLPEDPEADEAVAEIPDVVLHSVDHRGVDAR
jgi:hypothetical protein